MSLFQKLRRFVRHETPRKVERPCPWPADRCVCANGIGCANVPVEEW